MINFQYKLKDADGRRLSGNEMKQLPFNVQQVKKKKKSIASQKMKQKKITLKKQNKIIYKQQPVSDNELIPCKPPLKITPDPVFDNINYIALQQFQGTIQDNRTLQTYKRAISNNSHLIANKIILHLTSGCNIFYSIYAAQAGASKVYCVVNSSNLSDRQNISMVQQIVRENDFGHIIQVLSWKDFNAEVDVIIGEPMGFCMHYDGILDRMIQARDLYLDKSTGIIMPDKMSFKAALINDQHFYDKKIMFWDQVYSIPMKSMKKWISHEPIVKIVDPSLIVSEIKKFITFDLKTVSYEQISQITQQFQLKIYNKTQANGLTIWFQIQFNCEGQKVQLKASPWQNATKFTHVTLYSNKKLDFECDQNVKIKTYGKKYPHHGVSVMKVNIIDKVEGVYTFS